MQIKTRNYYCRPFGWSKSGTLTIPNSGKDVETQKLSFIAGGDAKWYSLFEKLVGSFLQN